MTFDVGYVFDHFIDKKGGINKGCKHIAKLLNNQWVYKHIYNVYRGAKPSDKLRKKLIALIKPPIKRNRKIIEATSKNQLDSWNELSPDELRHALDREVILRRI